jgi:hypothetical protein
MSTYIQNYGFTKTFIKDNHHKSANEFEWIGDYDGNIANIQLNMNDNGEQRQINMKLDNNDLLNMLKIQPNELSLENRLSRDFLGKPIALDSLLYKRKRKTHKHRKHRKHRRKTHRH